MKQNVGIKIVIFTIIGNKLMVFAPDGHLPATVWKRGMRLEEEAAKTIDKSLGLPLPSGYLEQLYTVSSPDEKDFDIAVVYYFLVPGYKVDRLDGWVTSVSSSDRTIIAYATQRFRWKIEYTNVVRSLLPDEFVFGELQRVYEAVLGRPMDKRNFRKKIFSLHILKDTGKKRVSGRARPAELYTFANSKLTIVEIL